MGLQRLQPGGEFETALATGYAPLETLQWASRASDYPFRPFQNQSAVGCLAVVSWAVDRQKPAHQLLLHILSALSFMT